MVARVINSEESGKYIQDVFNHNNWNTWHVFNPRVTEDIMDSCSDRSLPVLNAYIINLCYTVGMTLHVSFKLSMNTE